MHCSFLFKDLIVDAARFSKPFCGGEGHYFMSTPVWDCIGPKICDLYHRYSNNVIDDNNYQLAITGHLLGAGTACFLTILLHSQPKMLLSLSVPSLLLLMLLLPNQENDKHNTNLASMLVLLSSLLSKQYVNSSNSTQLQPQQQPQQQQQRQQHGKPLNIKCFALAVPPVFTPLESVPQAVQATISFIHQHDIVPFLWYGIFSALQSIEDYTL